MDIIYFISGTLLGATIHHIATRLGAKTIAEGINVIVEPPPLEEGAEEEMKQLLNENSYNYDTYNEYIDGLEQYDETEDILIIEDIPKGEKN
jgi:hypothetical protein